MALTPGKFYWIQAIPGAWPNGVQPARYNGTDTNGVQVFHFLNPIATAYSPPWVGDEAIPGTPPPVLPPTPTPPVISALPYTVGFDFGDCRDVRGRTPVDPAIFQQPRTMVIVFDGQSMQGNYSQLTPYRPSTNEVYDLNVYDGKIYRCDGGPIFGSDGWPGRLSILPYLNDGQVVLGKAARVLRVSIIKGGTCAADWSPARQLTTRRHTALQALAALGLAPNRWVSVQGQGDLSGQPQYATTAEEYRALRAWGFQELRGWGYTGTIIVGLGCHWTGFSDNQAQAAVVRNGQLLLGSDAHPNVQPIALGPDDDQWVPDSQYRVDGVHWADNGRFSSTAAWAQAIPAV